MMKSKENLGNFFKNNLKPEKIHGISLKIIETQ